MKKNELTNIIKFLAAVLVIFSHSFAISQNKYDYLGNYTKGYVNFGGLAVAILFAISGFYIMKSLDKKGSKGFVKKRVLRLIPSLFIVVIFCIIILGLFFSDISVISYITDINTYKYLLNIIFIPIHNLPGVFQNNIYGSTVNGALWTMKVQFLCYMYVYFAYILKIGKKENKNLYLLISIILGICGCIIFNYLNIKVLVSMIRPFLCFVFGGYLYYSELNNKKYFITCILFSIICLVINNYFTINILLIVGINYIILYLCKNNSFEVDNKYLNMITLSSYELYLVGFPVQQSIVAINGGSMNIYFNFVIATLIAIPISVIVRMLSEKMITVFKI